MIKQFYGEKICNAIFKVMVIGLTEEEIGIQLREFTRNEACVFSFDLGYFEEVLFDESEDVTVETKVLLWFYKGGINRDRVEFEFKKFLKGVKVGILVSHWNKHSQNQILKYLKEMYLAGCRVFIFLMRDSEGKMLRLQMFKKSVERELKRRIHGYRSLKFFWNSFDPKDMNLRDLLMSFLRNIYDHLKTEVSSKVAPIIL